MKKILAFMLCLCMVVCAFAGCKNSDNTDTTTTTTETVDPKYNLSNILADDYSQYVTLGQYKDIEIRSDSEEYQKMRKQYIEYYLGQGGFVTEYENRPVENGDTVNIDYVGYCDGVAFEGGDTKGQGANLEIGSHSYIDDFEDQLIGSMPGDTVDVYVTFPENYGNETLNGKDAHFVVEVNYIASAPVYPDLATNLDILEKCFGYKTMDAFEEGIKKEIGQKVAEQMAFDGMTIIEYPQERYDTTKKEIEAYYTSIAQQYGITLEVLLSSQDIDIDEIVKEELKNELFYLAIAQSEGMSYTDEEYEQLCEDYAKQLGYASLDVLLETVVSQGSYENTAQAKYDLSSYILQQKANEVITSTVNVILVK